MTFLVNKPRKFGHLFSSAYCTCTSYESLFQFALTYIFPFLSLFRTAMYKRYINSVIIIIWKSNSSRFKMSKQKIRIGWLWRPRVTLSSRGFSWGVSSFVQVLKSHPRFFSRRRRSCLRPSADEGPRRTREKTSDTQGIRYGEGSAKSPKHF